MEQWEADISTDCARRLPSHQAIAEAQRLIALLTPHLQHAYDRGRKAERNRWDYQRRKVDAA